MFSQEDNTIASRSQLSDVFVVISNVFGLRTLDKQFFFDLDSLLLHDYQIFLHQYTNSISELLSFISFLLNINKLMESTVGLQKKVQNLNDQINDIFHATQLNLQALGVQLQAYNQSKVTLGTVKHCKEEFGNIKLLFDQRAKLRLQYLITEQIKEEQMKVRRERLVEYQQKIYDQRRLIADKQTFYDGLLKARRRRPAHMTIEEFYSIRRQEIAAEQRKNIKRLDEETNELKLIQRSLKTDNDLLQNYCQMLQRQDLTNQQLTLIENALTKSPTMYESIYVLPAKRDEANQIRQLCSNITQIQQQQSQLSKQYMQQKQLFQYLKWQHNKLKNQYQQKQNQKCESELKLRKRFETQGKYKLKRSVSI